jgi:hypothetical protein
MRQKEEFFYFVLAINIFPLDYVNTIAAAMRKKVRSSAERYRGSI